MLTLTYLPEGSFTFTSHASGCWHDSLCLSEFLVFREAFCATCGWQMPPLQGFLPNDPLTGWWLVKHNTVGFSPLLKHSWLACKVSGCVCVMSVYSCWQAPSLTVVMAFRAVSAPMLRSEPGTLLETVAGTMTMGTQNSSYFPRAVNNSSSDRKACRAEPSALVSARGLEGWSGREVLLATKERVRHKWRVPRGGARSITTDSSETDRYHSTFTLKKHTHVHHTQDNSFTCIHQRKSKAGEHLYRSAWNGWRKAGVLCFQIRSNRVNFS